MKQKTCARCQQLFEGRANKLYCSTACKSAVNNVSQLEKTKDLVETNKILRRNRRIMGDLFNLFKSQPISRDILQKTELNADYSTGAGIEGLCFYEYTLKKVKGQTDQFYITKTQN